MRYLAKSQISRGDSLSPSDSSQRPLHGLRVIDLSRYFPGPLTGRELVRLGALVIKVEIGAGDPAKFIQPMEGAWSVPYRLLNGGKAVLELNLREAPDRERLLELVKGADVLIESFRPGRLSDMGLSPEILLEVNPKLVIASLSGFGQASRRGGHDLGFLARSGFLAQTGPAESPPSPPGVPVGDLLGGTYPAVTQILAALYRVKAEGRGVHLDINMCSELERLAWLGASLNGFQASGAGRGKGMLTGGLTRYRVYAARDSALVAVGALEEKFWLKVVEELQRIDPKLTRDSTELQIENAFAQRDGDYWQSVLEPMDVCVEMVLPPRANEALKSSVNLSFEAFLEAWGLDEQEPEEHGLSIVEETAWDGQSSL